MAELAGKEIAYFEDKAVNRELPGGGMDPSIKDGTIDRIIHFVDGSTKTYRYNIYDENGKLNKNAENDPNVVIPEGATLQSGGVDKEEAALEQNRQRLEFERQRANVSDANQQSQQAGNLAAQTGQVMQPDASGTIKPVLDANGQPIPTLAAQAEARQATTAQAQAEASKAQAEATRANVEVNREQNQITKDRNAAQALYEQKQLDATKERDRLSALVSIGTIQAEAASQQFKNWLEVNVKLPFQQMEEARARATEARDAQKAEDLRRQNAAQFQQTRETSALSAGENAVKATIDTMPYMAGPKWGEQFGQALKGVAQGKPGLVNFNSEGLTFDMPDLEKIAADATARALAHLSPYAAAIAGAGDRPGGQYATTDYTGVPSPASPNTAPAPFNAAPILNQLNYPIPPQTPVVPPLGQGQVYE